MIKGLKLSTLISAAIGASPAIAADPAQLTCMIESMSPADQDRVALEVVTPYRGGSTRPLIAASHRCAARHGWSNWAREEAIEQAGAMLGVARMRREFLAAGVDATPLERAILADRELLDARMAGSRDPSMTAVVRHPALFARLQQGGALRPGDLGIFSSLVVRTETYRRRFERAQ